MSIRCQHWRTIDLDLLLTNDVRRILANFAATAGDATRKGRFLRAIRVQVTNKFGIPPRYIRKLDCRRGSVLLSLELAATADAPIGALMASYSRLQQQLSSGTLELVMDVMRSKVMDVTLGPCFGIKFCP